MYYEDEYDKCTKLVRNFIATGRFIAMRKSNCPVCNKECVTWYNVIKREKIIYCKNCYSDYIVRIRRHKL